jgi:seryl-tRNA synthetase
VKIEVHHYHHIGGDANNIERLLRALINQGVRIMSTQQEAAEQLTAVKEQLGKVAGETATLLNKIEELKAAVESSSQASPELQAAIEAVAAQAKIVDDMVPDAAPEVPTDQ